MRGLIVVASLVLLIAVNGQRVDVVTTDTSFQVTDIFFLQKGLQNKWNQMEVYFFSLLTYLLIYYTSSLTLTFRGHQRAVKDNLVGHFCVVCCQVGRGGVDRASSSDARGPGFEPRPLHLKKYHFFTRNQVALRS